MVEPIVSRALSSESKEFCIWVISHASKSFSSSTTICTPINRSNVGTEPWFTGWLAQCTQKRTSPLACPVFIARFVITCSGVFYFCCWFFLDAATPGSIVVQYSFDNSSLGYHWICHFYERHDQACYHDFRAGKLLQNRAKREGYTTSSLLIMLTTLECIFSFVVTVLSAS